MSKYTYCLRYLALFFIILILISGGCRKKVAVAQPAVEMGNLYMMNDRAVEAQEGLALRAKPVTSPSAEPNAPELKEKDTRQMIYQADIFLVVDNISKTLNELKEIAVRSGGYMQAMHEKSIVLKIPVKRFFDITSEVTALGEVIQKEITGSDVTDQMFDLNTRLKSAEKVLSRLLTLLERAEKVEDAIKIEKEIERLTLSIEQLKGSIRQMENRIAYSTVTVVLNSPLPQKQVKEEVPFYWVRMLGEEMLHPQDIDVADDGWGVGIKFKLPKSFAKYYEKGHVTRATSADGILIKVHRNKNVEGADLEFWANLIRKSLLMKRGISIKGTRSLKARDNTDLQVIEGFKEIGGTPYLYRIGICQTNKHVFVYEAWGKEDLFSARENDIIESAKSMRVLPLFKRIFN